MILSVLVYVSIIVLIYTNGLTDAPNAISTVVGTKVLSFKKAAILSAFFNLFGIIFMSFFNLSVANSITSMVDLSNKTEGMCVIFAGIISTIIFANVALKFGIPTSETHSLIAGLTGALIAYKGINNINFAEWKSVVIGLLFSIIGVWILTKTLNILLKNILYKMSDKIKKKMQIFSSMGVSFMHGAQDGQKFIGVLIVFYCLVNNIIIPSNANPTEYIGLIILTSIIMFIGVAIGGKKIVDTLGTELTILRDEEALISDFSTILILLISSINGIPISTSHVKTVSIVASAEDKHNVNKNKLFDIFKTWFYTFPVCGILSYFVMKVLGKIILGL